MGPHGDAKIPLTAKENHGGVIRAGGGTFVGAVSDF